MVNLSRNLDVHEITRTLAGISLYPTILISSVNQEENCMTEFHLGSFRMADRSISENHSEASE